MLKKGCLPLINSATYGCITGALLYSHLACANPIPDAGSLQQQLELSIKFKIMNHLEPM